MDTRFLLLRDAVKTYKANHVSGDLNHDTLLDFITELENQHDDSNKSNDISRISGRYYVFTVHNGKLIQDSIALPEMKDAEHYVETMKQGARGKNQEFVILSNAH